MSGLNYPSMPPYPFVPPFDPPGDASVYHRVTRLCHSVTCIRTTFHQGILDSRRFMDQSGRDAA